jgi:hypothetical protein
LWGRAESEVGDTLGGPQAQHPVLVLLLDLQKLHEQGGGAAMHAGRPAPGAGAEAAALAAVRAVAIAELVRGRALHVPSMDSGAQHDEHVEEHEQEDASYVEGERPSHQKMLFVHADGWVDHDLRPWARRLGAHTLPAVVIWDPVAEASYLLQPSNIKCESLPRVNRMPSYTGAVPKCIHLVHMPPCSLRVPPFRSRSIVVPPSNAGASCHGHRDEPGADMALTPDHHGGVRWHMVDVGAARRRCRRSYTTFSQGG